MPYKDPTSPESIEAARAARRKHYEKNKQAYKERAKAVTVAMREYVQAIKEANPCTDCRKHYPYYVMQFDHIGDDKVANVQSLCSKGNWQKLKDEIEKCELVCANCHAVRTWTRSRG